MRLLAFYKKLLVENDEDGYYVADVPELQGCHTQAKNQKELMKGVKEVIELCLEINTSTFYNIISPIRPQIYAFQLVSI